MNKKTIWTIVIIVVLVAVGIILLNLPPKKAAPGTVSKETTETTPGEVAPGIVPKEQAAEALKGVEVVPVATPGTTKEEAGKESAEGVTVKLNVSASGFEPKEFDVNAGQMVTLSVSSGDMTHVFKFDAPELQNVALGLASNETRAIAFKAPAGKGDYSFYCDVPGHRARGETGVMHVK